MATISQFGAIIPAGLLTPEVEKALTYHWKDYKDRDFHQSLVKRGAKYCFLPRFSVFWFGMPISVKLHRGKDIDVQIAGKLQDVQENIIGEIMSKEFSTPDAGNAGVLLKLGTGFGKTYIAMGLIAQVKKKTLIVCHRISLAMQWRKCIGEFLSGVSAGDIVVEVVNTLERANTEFFQQFGFIIFDEVHKYCTIGRYEKVMSR